MSCEANAESINYIWSYFASTEKMKFTYMRLLPGWKFPVSPSSLGSPTLFLMIVCSLVMLNRRITLFLLYTLWLKIFVFFLVLYCENNILSNFALNWVIKETTCVYLVEWQSVLTFYAILMRDIVLLIEQNNIFTIEICKEKFRRFKKHEVSISYPHSYRIRQAIFLMSNRCRKGRGFSMPKKCRAQHAACV